MHKLLFRLGQYSRCTMVAEVMDESTKHQHNNRSLDQLLKGRVYIEELPSDIEPIRSLLEKYSGIRSKDVNEHIYRIRERLWDICPHVSIGHFRFLSLKFTLDPLYHVALGQLMARSSSNFLDVGCCVGQVLRQLALDGVDSSRLYGTDLEPRFLDAGFDLFKDKAKTQATFVSGDMLRDGEGDGDLKVLEGKMGVIHATSFFHLFTWDDQIRAAVRMVRFLDPDDPEAMIFGRNVGTTIPGVREGTGGSKKYLHNAESWQNLWNEVGKLTGTSWRTEVNDIEEPGMHLNSIADGTLRRIRYGVFRA
ncbi:hypothetical protein GGR53DRAFT_523351 [Hypoxylon sp. FL1150]|nr:hypothetical protein GGR53DRAFT_523351 [Hypoxylon sp. FL1150]